MISPASVALWIAFVFAAAATKSYAVFVTGIIVGCIAMMLAVLERGGEG